MRWSAFLPILVFGVNAGAQSPANRLWNELRAKRENLAGVHQEFEVTRTQETAHDRQSIKWQVVVDMSHGRWRQTTEGLGGPIQVFDGKDAFSFEDGEKEYVRVKHGSTGDIPMPSAYEFDALDWPKGVERERLPCGIQGLDHTCVALEIPIKPWIKQGSYSHVTRLTDGLVRVIVDTETGLLMLSRIVEEVEGDQCTCRTGTQYTVKRQSYGVVPAAGLFTLPVTHTQQVKELPRWNATRIRKNLAGKPAPEFIATDLAGTRVDLSELRGKTVLLDFWASWCAPCRADAPQLRKLHQRYGDKDLAIIGVSTGEDRKIVEKFLKDHPAGYSIVLSAENHLPLPYQVNVIPTYVIVDPDGAIQTAVEGNKSFFDLRDLLKKAGLEMN
jgi:thiol-disulfide isomerase/thioredoxin